MSTKDLDTLSERLKSILGNTRCPMCGNDKFVVTDGYTTTPLQNSLETFQIGGPSIPCVAIICTKCGHMSQHAIGVLDGSAFLRRNVEKEGLQ